MSAVSLVFLIGLCLLAQLLVARRLPKMVGALVVIQVVYWAISYLLRPIVLLSVRPPPKFGDSVADARLAAGGYEDNLANVLSPVVYGLAAYVFFLLLLSLIAKPRPSSRDFPSGLVAALTACFVIGLLGRVLAISGQGANPVVSVLVLLGAVSAAGLVIYAPLKSRAALFWIALVCASEVGWAILSKSKTPVLALIVAVILRFVWLGWTRRRRIYVALAGVAGAASFSALQALKFDDATGNQVSAAAGNYPPLVAPLMPIITRFDLLSAITDAVALRGSTWLTSEQLIERAAQSLLPQQIIGVDKVTAGRSWALEVSSQSQAGVGDFVSRADGFIAEGFALGGTIGVVAAAAFLAVVTYAVGRLMQAESLLARSTGLIFVVTPIIFERGMLGFFDAAGKGIQILILIAIVSALARAVILSRATEAHNQGRATADLPAVGVAKVGSKSQI